MKRKTYLFVLASILSVFVFILLLGCKSETMTIKDENGQLYSAAKLLLKGQEAYDNKKYDLALAYYQAILDNYPKDDYYCAWAYYETGFVYFETEKYKEAKETLNTLVEKYPEQKEQIELAKLLLAKIAKIEEENNNKSS